MAHISMNFEANDRSPKETDYILSKLLANQTEDPVLLHKHFPKQTDIDRFLEQINRRTVLRNTHLLGLIRDLEAAYLHGPHFRDIYIYLQQNRVPSNKRLAKRMEIQVYNYHVPSSKVELLLHQYHTSLIGHNEITKT